VRERTAATGEQTRTTDRRERPCDARGGDGQAKSSSRRRSRSRSHSRSRRRRAYTVCRRVGRATARRAPHTLSLARAHTQTHTHKYANMHTRVRGTYTNTRAYKCTNTQIRVHGVGYCDLPPVHVHKGRPQRASVIMRSCAAHTPRHVVSLFHAKRRT